MVQRYNFLGRRKNLPLSLCGHAGLCGLPRKNPGALEMADILGISKANVAVKLNRTKEKLKQMVKE